MHFSQPIVTVIVPNYEHAPYLNKRINSILEQTYQDFELIILDDLSRDNSKDIINQYRDNPKVTSIIYNEINSGSTFKQWNRGIELARGSWIWIAESDDFADPNLLEELVKKVSICPRTVLAYCQSFETNEKNVIVRELSWHIEDLDDQHWQSDFCNNGRDEIYKYLLYRNTIPNASAVLFRKDAYLKADKQFINMRLCGDWFLWVELLLQGDIAFHARPLNYFRSHSATTRVLVDTKKMRLRLEEEYLVLQNIQGHISSESQSPVRERLKSVREQYRATFTKADILQLLLHPSRYKSPIPLRYLLADYFKNKILN